jgi:hypothetical protein
MKWVYKCLLHELDYFAYSCSINYMGFRFTGHIVATLDIYTRISVPEDVSRQQRTQKACYGSNFVTKQQRFLDLMLGRRL